jgi:hypothetical protein
MGAPSLDAEDRRGITSRNWHLSETGTRLVMSEVEKLGKHCLWGHLAARE